VSESEFTALPMFGRRVPDFSVETDESGHKYKQELPGTFEVGFMLEGVFRPIYTMKAAGLLADIERAKKAADAAPPADAPTVPAVG
jgi:hypothetical protein